VLVEDQRIDLLLNFLAGSGQVVLAEPACRAGRVFFVQQNKDLEQMTVMCHLEYLRDPGPPDAAKKSRGPGRREEYPLRPRGLLPARPELVTDGVRVRLAVLGVAVDRGRKSEERITEYPLLAEQPDGNEMLRTTEPVLLATRTLRPEA